MATQSTAPSKAIQKRIAKRGAITNADIQEYIDEVGIANLGNMSMNDVEQFLKTFVELGQRQKKKLPTKKKIEKTDSVVVADQAGNLAKVAPTLSTDSDGPMVPRQGAMEQQDVQERGPGRFRKFVGSAAGGLLGLGSLAFNKMFPTLGQLMTAFDKRIRKQDSDLDTVNINNQENARQVSRSSIFMSRIVENQLRTNELLEQIIAVTAPGATLVPQSNTNINVDLDGPDLPRRRGRRRSSAAAVADGRTSGQQTAQRTTPAPAASSRGSGRGGAAVLAFAGIGAAVSGAAYAATRPTSATAGAAQSANGAAAPEAVEPAIPSLPTPPPMTAEALQTTAAPITEQEQAELFANRVLNIRARDIIFKADRFEFDQGPVPASGTAAAAPPPVTPSVGGGAMAAAATATAAGASAQIQTIIERITQEFPNIVVTSTARPNDTNSQHATGNAVDLSLRGLSQEQRATLIQNITTGRYGNVGGLGTYNASGDLLHVDTRSGARMAWGPNRSRTSLNQTPQWFQAAVTPWMSGATATAQREQEPGPGGEQMATATPSRPSTGAQVAEASVRSEVSMMQSQQVSSTLGEAPEQPASPTGSMEQSATMIDPNEPGSVEPADAAQRYARLFNIAA